MAQSHLDRGKLRVGVGKCKGHKEAVVDLFRALVRYLGWKRLYIGTGVGMNRMAALAGCVVA